MSTIECVAYASQARIGLHELSVLVRWSRERNEHLGISGLLLYDADHFFGYVEGEPQRVQSLFDAIRVDSRHQSLRLLHAGPLGQRRLDRWSMGYLYDPMFSGELESLWAGKQPLGDLDARLRRWLVEGDVL